MLETRILKYYGYIMKKLLVLICCLITASCALVPQWEPKSYFALRGGLDTSALKTCLYTADGSNFKPEIYLPNSNFLKADLSKELGSNKQCKQAIFLASQFAWPYPNTIQSNGNLTTFYTVRGDGQTAYYMLDKQGQLMALTDQLDITQDSYYTVLAKRYPPQGYNQVSLSLSATQAPTFVSLNDGTQRVMFKQAVKYGACVACKQIATANIAYDFNKNGFFVGANLLGLSAT